MFNGLMVDQGMLKGQADADYNGTVSIHEAFQHAARIAPEMTADQHYGPQHPYIAGGNGTEWFLKPPAPASRLVGELPGGGLTEGLTEDVTGLTRIPG